MNDPQPASAESQDMTSPWPERQDSRPSSSEQYSTPKVAGPFEAPQATPPVYVSPQPAPVSAPTAPTPVVPGPGQPMAPASLVQPNPGQTLGIVSIVLGVLTIWVVGLPLAIVSMVKSSKANASKTLGIVGLVLNILAILVTTFMILVLLMALPALQESARKAQAATDAATLAASQGTISLSDNYKPLHTDVSFTMPANLAGWSVVTPDQKGTTQFNKDDDAATFMTYHGVLESAVGDDKTVTQSAMTGYISQLEMVEVSNSESTISFQCESDGKMLEFETKQVTGTSEGRNIKGILAVRMYEGHELSVIYLADADAFSLSEWNYLASQVTVNDRGTS